MYINRKRLITILHNIPIRTIIPSVSIWLTYSLLIAVLIQQSDAVFDALRRDGGVDVSRSLGRSAAGRRQLIVLGASVQAGLGSWKKQARNKHEFLDIVSCCVVFEHLISDSHLKRRHLHQFRFVFYILDKTNQSASDVYNAYFPIWFLRNSLLFSAAIHCTYPLVVHILILRLIVLHLLIKTNSVRFLGLLFIRYSVYIVFWLLYTILPYFICSLFYSIKFLIIPVLIT